MGGQPRASFADEEHLIPCEVEAEMNEGRVARRGQAEGTSGDEPWSWVSAPWTCRLELGWPRALRTVDQVAVWEQLGRVTNALCWCFSGTAPVDVRGL